MSGVVSGIGKLFTSAVSGVARIGQAVSAVGRTVFSAGAAAAGGSMASGGLTGIVQSFTGNGVLGNILSNAISTAIPGALIGGAVGAVTGQGFMKGALAGGLGGALMGGVSGAMQPAAGIQMGNTPTGMAPTGTTGAGPSSVAPMPAASAAAAAPSTVVAPPPAAPAPAAAPAGGGFMSMFSGQTGAALLQGAGQGLAGYLQQKGTEEEAQRDRDMIRAREQRITDSYNVDPSVLAGGSAMQQDAAPQQTAESTVVPPQSTQKYGRQPRYKWDRASSSMIISQA